MNSKKKFTTILSVKDLFTKSFTEQSAIDWLTNYRWNGTVVCTKCNSSDRVKVDSRKNNYYCSSCRYRFTVRVGTVMESSRIEVRDWLYAMYLVLTSSKGISSMQLSRELGCTQKTSWFLIHRIRESCNSKGGKLLSGTVEIDTIDSLAEGMAGKRLKYSELISK